MILIGEDLDYAIHQVMLRNIIFTVDNLRIQDEIFSNYSDTVNNGDVMNWGTDKEIKSS